jgi:hypothetical protein
MDMEFGDRTDSVMDGPMMATKTKPKKVTFERQEGEGLIFSDDESHDRTGRETITFNEEVCRPREIKRNG